MLHADSPVAPSVFNTLLKTLLLTPEIGDDMVMDATGLQHSPETLLLTPGRAAYRHDGSRLQHSPENTSADTLLLDLRGALVAVRLEGLRHLVRCPLLIQDRHHRELRFVKLGPHVAVVKTDDLVGPVVLPHEPEVVPCD